MNGTLPLSNKKGFTVAVVIGVLGLAVTVLLFLLWTGDARGVTSTHDAVTSGVISAGTRTNEANAVTVSIAWPGVAAGPVFKVALDTHSVDLGGYDLRQLATLRVDQGPEIRATGWDAPSGSHHRAGTVTFPATNAEGRPLMGPATRAIELVIRDLAGVPQRTFRWSQ